MVLLLRSSKDGTTEQIPQIFKKICGLTPSEYRKQYRENSR